VDLKLAMNQSLSRRPRPPNQDDRELGLLVYHLFVGEADKLGTVTGTPVVDAGPIVLPSPSPSPAAKAPAKAAAPKA
jgi:hypothetical protein